MRIVIAISAFLSALVAAASAGPAYGSAHARELRWPPPRLDAPIVVRVATAGTRLFLDPRRDYIVRLPREPLRTVGGLWIVGGHNVVVRGGEISVPWTSGAGPEQTYGLFAKNQTGTLHLEGLRIRGRGLGDGIVLAQSAGATVQIENCRVEVRYPIPADYSVHPDILQTWSGPKVLRIDRLTGFTTDKGLTLQPRQYNLQRLGVWDLRRIDIAGGRYLLWKADWNKQLAAHVGFWRVRQHKVWVRPGRTWGWAWPDRARWQPVRRGRPAGGHYVPARAAGLGYVSPGYRDGAPR